MASRHEQLLRMAHGAEDMDELARRGRGAIPRCGIQNGNGQVCPLKKNHNGDCVFSNVPLHNDEYLFNAFCPYCASRPAVDGPGCPECGGEP